MDYRATTGSCQIDLTPPTSTRAPGGRGEVRWALPGTWPGRAHVFVHIVRKGLEVLGEHAGEFARLRIVGDFITPDVARVQHFRWHIRTGGRNGDAEVWVGHGGHAVQCA